MKGIFKGQNSTFVLGLVVVGALFVLIKYQEAKAKKIGSMSSTNEG